MEAILSSAMDTYMVSPKIPIGPFDTAESSIESIEYGKYIKYNLSLSTTVKVSNHVYDSPLESDLAIKKQLVSQFMRYIYSDIAPLVDTLWMKSMEYSDQELRKIAQRFKEEVYGQ